MASAGYGLDHIAAVDILRTIRSVNGFIVVIILKPFGFEGQRRHDEVVCAGELSRVKIIIRIYTATILR